MNNEFVVRESEAFAQRVAAAAGADPAAQVRLAWRIALTAEPSPEQLATAVEFLAQQRADLAGGDGAGSSSDAGPSPAGRALATFCQALLSSNAFLYVD
jgi:hypothetical protein